VRRGDLLDAAARLFVERGYEATTVEDIARAAGVAKGTFYLYFRTKDQLLTALRQAFVDDLVQRVSQLQRPRGRGGWRSYIDGLVGTAIDAHVAARELHDVVTHGPHERPHARHGAGEADPIRIMLREITMSGVAAGAFRLKDPGTAADLVYDMLHAAADHVCHAPARAGEITAAAREMTWRALSGRP